VFFEVYNEQTGEHYEVATEYEVNQFAAQAAVTPGHMGAGDVFAAAVRPLAQALGLENCSPCAARQAMMNRMAPAVMRRR
jgi:hypothetical protein